MNNESHSVCRVFISHSSRDDEFCTQLAEDLRGELGENAVWYDNLRLRPGDSWWRIIVEQVALCNVFILIISPASMESDWVQREYSIALRQKKRIIPVLYQEANNIWDDLKDIHHISFTKPDMYKSAFARLCQGLPTSKSKISHNTPEEGDLKKILDTIREDSTTKNWNKLIGQVEELKKLSPESVTSLIYYWQAEAFLALDRRPDAIYALEKAHAMESGEKGRLRILTKLIPTLSSLKLWAEVEKSTATALKLSPEEPLFLTHRRDALLALLKATNDKEQYLEPIYELCTALASSGRWNDILIFSEEALRLLPDDPRLLTQRRDALLNILNNREWRLKLLSELYSVLAALNQWDDDMLRCSEEMLRLAPNDPHVLNQRCEVLERLLLSTNDQKQRLRFLGELCSVLAALNQWDDMLKYSEEVSRLAFDEHDSHFPTQLRDVLERLLANAHDQELHVKVLRELCFVLASLGQWKEVLRRTREVRRLAPRDYDIIKLQNSARIHQGAFKVSGVYDRFFDWTRACIAYWGRFVQNLLSGLQQLIRRRWFAWAAPVLLILLIIGSILVFLSPALSQSTSSSMVIKIGVSVPGRGDSKDNGLPIEKAVELALGDAHIAGYKLEPDFLDEVPPGSNSPDPVQAKKNMQNFSNDAQVAGVVGPYESSIATEIMPEANNAPLALISPSNTYTCLTKNNSDAGCGGKNDILPVVRPTGQVTYFRVATPDDYQGPAMADYLFKLLHSRRSKLTAYVVDDAEVYGMGLATSFIKEWQKLNGSIIAYKHDANTGDYQSMVQPMAPNPPDVVFFGGRTDRGAEEFYQTMQRNNIAQKTVYAGGSGLISPPDFIGIVSPITNPIYASFPFADVENLPNPAGVIDHFKRVEGVNFYGKYTAAGYDSANVLIQAIKTAISKGAQPPKSADDARGAKAFRQAVIDAIKGIAYTGITGPISFDKNGDTNNRALTIYSVVDGQSDWKCLEQVTINNPSTVKWLNSQNVNGCALEVR